MSQFLNLLSTFVIVFLPRSKCVLITRLQSLSTVTWEPKKINLSLFPLFLPCICHEAMGLDAMILVFRMLRFKLDFWLSPFTLKRLFSSSLLSDIRAESSAYLSWLIFLPVNLITALWFIQPCISHDVFCTKVKWAGKKKVKWAGWQYTALSCFFPILNQLVFLCPVLTVASRLAFRFLRRQVRWSGIPIPLRIFSSLWSTQAKALA